ncbi:transcriptional regulator, TetR family [gamma proteobacterium HTCC5015]|nr:transcriptional regulator, TetR family [gamma proteobacterium HTCC5015]
MNKREEQKRQTRRRIMSAALELLGDNRSVGTLGQREVAKAAGIASSSFYRHFDSMESLLVALVEEGTHKLQLLMNRGRKQGMDQNHTVVTSVDTFFEFVRHNPNYSRLMLRENTWGSQAYRLLIKAAIQRFVDDIAAEIARVDAQREERSVDAPIVAEAMVSLLFNIGSQALDQEQSQWPALREKLIVQIRLVLLGAYQYHQVYT